MAATTPRVVAATAPGTRRSTASPQASRRLGMDARRLSGAASSTALQRGRPRRRDPDTPTSPRSQSRRAPHARRAAGPRCRARRRHAARPRSAPDRGRAPVPARRKRRDRRARPLDERQAVDVRPDPRAAHELSATTRRFGVVLFSDVAYEASRRRHRRGSYASSSASSGPGSATTRTATPLPARRGSSGSRRGRRSPRACSSPHSSSRRVSSTSRVSS